MTELHVCIPTLNRYDLLDKCIESLRRSELLPTAIWVIDNGGGYMNPTELDFTDAHGIQHHYRKFGYNLGCAASWNWFMRNVPEMRLICNDDILFTPTALSALVQAYREDALISPDSTIGSNAYSCFLIPDRIVNEVGRFDESISPNWAYWEDNDHFRRLTLAGYSIQPAPNCLVAHPVSSTLRSLTDEEMKQHHQRYRDARIRYLEKWGGEPHHEQFTIPYNGETILVEE